MKRAAKAGIGALAAALIFAGWAALAWNTGLGGELFIEPGRLIADVAIPQASPTETFHAKSANSPGEAVAQFVMARSLERGLQAWWCAVAFWLIRYQRSHLLPSSRRVAMAPNSALLTDAFSSLRCACGAAKRGR
jgi:hypothetical protein